jgi:GTPase SAR1 family protein
MVGVLAQGFVLVYDVTKKSTLEDLEPIKEMVWKIKKATNKKPPPILLIGNKTDMPGREVRWMQACKVD